MTDKKNKAAEVGNLMDELFESKPKNIKGLKEVYQVPKPTVRDKKETNKIVHENQPTSGGTVVHGSNSQIINNKAIDYKIDNTAIENGRASIGLRKRGDRVNTIHMSPKEFRNFLYFTYKIPGKNGWNGIEKSDFAQNWEADESQVITTKEAALKYLKIQKNKMLADGIEKRTKSTRRTGKKDYRKDKQDRRTLKQRRKDDFNNNLTYFATIIVLLLSLGSWISYSVILYIRGLA